MQSFTFGDSVHEIYARYFLWLMSEIGASVTKGSHPTFLDARLHGHDVIPAQAGIQGFAQILDMNLFFFSVSHRAG
jgi:hypothetical protein